MKIIDGAYIILGNLICGTNGVLEATQDITWEIQGGDQFKTKEEFYTWALHNFEKVTIQNGDLDLMDRDIQVVGPVYIWGKMLYDPETYIGHISCGTPINISLSTSLRGWVARDYDGELWLFIGNKPVRRDDPSSLKYSEWVGSGAERLDKDLFPKVRWENEPMEVKFTISPKR